MISLGIALTFFVVSLGLAIAPGPDIIFVLTQSVLYGFRAGLATTLGLVSGLLVHTTLVAVGVAAIIQASPVAFLLLKLAGAGYLLYLARLSLRAGALLAQGGQQEFLGYGALFRRGIVMNVSNPKVSLFFLAFLPQFCRPEQGSVALQVAQLGVLFMLAALLVFGAVSLLGGRLASWFNSSPHIQVLIHRLAACVFVGLAASLLFSSL